MRFALTKQRILEKLKYIGIKEGDKIAVGAVYGRQVRAFIGVFKLTDKGIEIGTKCRHFDFHAITNVGKVVDEKRRLIWWAS